MSKFKELNERVIQWADSKGILEKATPLTQIGKTYEELEELRDALFAQNNDLENYRDSKNRTENTKESIKYELAGCLVTLMIQSKLQNLDILKCLELEIDKIEKRKGKMIEGTFVKD